MAQSYLKVNQKKCDGENKTLLEAQNDNKDIQLVRQWVEKGKRPVFTDGSRYRYVVKSQWIQRTRWFLSPSMDFASL